ncbi:MAG: NAD(P)-dependent oxidoreductase [Defluviitaleaceae bacterium]|nr:NAD(P)-dependent oxidoreductase [Defluviitaleaceae bacterium]
MLNINQKLKKREEQNQIINTAIVGAGQMGRGLTTQMFLMKGIRPAIVSDTSIASVVESYEYAGIKRDDIVIAKTLTQANDGIKNGKYVATEDSLLLTQAHNIDCVIDATGIPDVGAQIATESIKHKKHVVMLNVETDVVIGPYLKAQADKAGVVYTGSAGDEPGAVMELYTFADAMGFDIKVIGKGKNNKLDRSSTPATAEEEAIRRKMSPKMLCSFKDGTKTMVEMAAMSNATGFVPDITGGHGIKATLNELNEKFKLKKDGGIFNRHQVVEFVDGVAPGVFVTISTTNEEIAYQMGYHSMGSGPLWTLYRPYHLCNLETPLTVAKAVIEKEATIVPISGLVSECITVAKVDLKTGQFLDGIGGYTAYGSIATIQESNKNGYVPFGLVNNKTKMKKDVKKGQILTLEDLELDTNTLIYKLRLEQNKTVDNAYANPHL